MELVESFSKYYYYKVIAFDFFPITTYVVNTVYPVYCKNKEDYH